LREAVLQYLACSSCRGDLALVASEVDGEEIVSGILRCAACAAEYAVRGGVPRMNEAMDGLEHVAKTFGFEWKEHLQGRLESDTVFGRSRDEEWRYFQEATGFRGRELAGAVVLDAGCGPGQVARQVAKQDAALAVGMDINDAVDDAYRNCLDLPNVQIVQGNIFAPPFKPGCFDLVWCNGVAHHTPDARGAHRSLSRLVRPGGTFYIWVYAKRFNPFRFTKDVLDFLQVTRLPEPALMNVAKAFSYLSLGVLKLYQAFHRLPPFRPRTKWEERKVRDRTLEELNLTWFDALSPDYDSRHSEAEVIGWFRSLGFQDIHAIEEPKVGVRGVAAASREAS
jgi:SAM-dependent methyltransferase